MISVGSEVRVLPGPLLVRMDNLDGGVAQLVERLLCKQEVVGSIPSASIVCMVCVRCLFVGSLGSICMELDFVEIVTRDAGGLGKVRYGLGGGGVTCGAPGVFVV